MMGKHDNGRGKKIDGGYSRTSLTRFFDDPVAPDSA